MPLTNAEKQRRYRERLKNNPEKQEEIRKKNLDRIKKNTKKNVVDTKFILITSVINA